MVRSLTDPMVQLAISVLQTAVSLFRAELFLAFMSCSKKHKIVDFSFRHSMQLVSRIRNFFWISFGRKREPVSFYLSDKQALFLMQYLFVAQVAEKVALVFSPVVLFGIEKSKRLLDHSVCVHMTRKVSVRTCRSTVKLRRTSSVIKRAAGEPSSKTRGYCALSVLRLPTEPQQCSLIVEHIENGTSPALIRESGR